MSAESTRLLIIEDDEPVLESMRRLFARGPCQVETAATLADGLDALDPPPDCLILDLKLPDGDGVAVLHLMGDHGLPIRVALCKGADERDHLTAVAGLSPRTLLGKPIDVEELTAALGFRPV